MKINIAKLALLTVSLIFSVSYAQEKTSDWQMIEHFQVENDLVKDTTTGLMWMRCALGQKWDGSTCQGNALKYTWDNVLRASDGFNYAGYSDWRIPDFDELKTLIYCSSGQIKNMETIGVPYCKDNFVKPTIAKSVFPETPLGGFWSSELCAGNNNCRLIVNFNGIYGYGDPQFDSLAVRLVRKAK